MPFINNAAVTTAVAAVIAAAAAGAATEFSEISLAPPPTTTNDRRHRRSDDDGGDGGYSLALPAGRRSCTHVCHPSDGDGGVFRIYEAGTRSCLVESGCVSSCVGGTGDKLLSEIGVQAGSRICVDPVTGSVAVLGRADLKHAARLAISAAPYATAS
jgi:hypothetical protein